MLAALVLALAVPPIVPMPRAIRMTAGSFAWPARPRIAVAGAPAGVASPLRAAIAELGPRGVFVESARGADVVVQFADVSRAMPADAYALDVSPRGVRVRASSASGVFYAAQTLAQISARDASGAHTPAAHVDDRPEYRWRGVHVDVARHVFGVAVLERIIDAAARVKLNVLHLHLTDDEAWRIPSARYPELTRGSAHYSADDVRRLVDYARTRFVTIVPEVDLPAHTGAVRRAYPTLVCGAVLCDSAPARAFAGTVVAEAMTLFSARYVHAGGDEVPARAQLFARDLASELHAGVRLHGGRLVVWDDAVEANPMLRTIPDDEPAVTVWTSRRRAVDLARHGFDVVVASAPLYFDAAQGDATQEPRSTPYMATLREVYDAGVVPPALDAAARAHVLGVEGCVWTEYIATPDRLFTALFPRTFALAEIAWTPRSAKRWDGFVERLPAQLAWLEAHGIAFRIPNVTFDVTGGPLAFDAVPAHVQSVVARTAAARVTVALSVPLRDAEIRYTTDGSDPSPASTRYGGPFAIDTGARPRRVRAAAFSRGRRGATSDVAVVRAGTASLRARPGSHAWSSLVSP